MESFELSEQETDPSDVPKNRTREVISDGVDRDSRISLESQHIMSQSEPIHLALRRYRSGLEGDTGSVILLQQKEDALCCFGPSALIGCSLHVSWRHSKAVKDSRVTFHSDFEEVRTRNYFSLIFLIYTKITLYSVSYKKKGIFYIL